MAKPGRNDPCPCGSGKKYKNCCIDKESNVVSFPMDKRFEDNLKRYQNTVENWNSDKDGPAPTFNEFMGNPNMATSAVKGIQESMDKMNFGSIDELNAYMKSTMKTANNAPRDEFLGLSSSIMNEMLNKDFGDYPHIVDINSMVNPELAQDTPALKQCRYLLEVIGCDEKGLKATQKGNLPRDLVRDFYDKFIRENSSYPHTPSGEDDVKDIQKAKFFLRDSGYIKFKSGRYSITKKGSTLLDSFYPGIMYHEIMLYFIKEYNWLYRTRYDDVMDFIQISASFCFYIIKMKADNFISGNELGNIYLRAFPTLAESFPLNYGEQMVKFGFTYVFLHEIAFYLGLVDERGNRKMLLDEIEYRSTDLFREVLHWKV